MNLKKLLCMIMAMLLAFGAMALAEDDADLQAQLNAANERIAQLEAEVELYRPYYENQIVAEFGEDGIIWLADAQKEFEAASSAYSQYGLSIDDYADEVKQQILETLVQTAVMDQKAAELGLDQLDEEVLAGLEAEAAENFETYIDSYKGYFASEDATEEQAREQTIAALESYGLTQETLLEQMRGSYVSEQLYNYVTKDVVVTDEDIQAAYEAMIADDEASYTSDYSYNSARNNGTVIAWNPEGYRAVKHVLIKFDDEQATQYSNLKSTLDSLNAELAALDAPAEETEETADAGEETEEEEKEPRTREEIQADITAVVTETEALYSQLLPKAQQVIDEFKAGTDFDSLIEAYNDDPGMQNEPTATNGYAVAAGSTTWDPAFTEGAMSIEAVGDISAPIYGQNGIHIIYYMADITPGAVPFEEIAEAAESEARDTKLSETYNSQVDAWVEEANPVYHIDRF